MHSRQSTWINGPSQQPNNGQLKDFIPQNMKIGRRSIVYARMGDVRTSQEPVEEGAAP